MGELTKFRSALKFLSIDENDELAKQWERFIKSEIIPSSNVLAR